MKHLPIIMLITFVFGLAGCFDDGNDTTTTTDPAPTDSNGASTSIVLATGTKTVTADGLTPLATLTVGEPGEIEVTVEWSTGPSELSISVTDWASSTGSDSGGSPLRATLTVTQDEVDADNTEFYFYAENNHLTRDAEVTYTATFTPSD